MAKAKAKAKKDPGLGDLDELPAQLQAEIRAVMQPIPLVPGTRVITLCCTGPPMRGKIVGKATVFPVRMPDGVLKSMKNPEVRPHPACLPSGSTQLCLEANLKVKLDHPVEGRDHVYAYEALIVPDRAPHPPAPQKGKVRRGE